MSRNLSALFALALFVGWTAGEADARCLRYEPATVTLTGRLSERVTPGPPRYHNIALGDIPEKVLFLALDRPICVTGDPMLLRNSRTFAGIEELQVRYTGVRRSALIGKRVRATGSLFAAHSDSHRTPVILTAIGMRETDD
ncbi:MAG: DUF4431 domain-containing protein [Deltaproteobacteria bacterium]|nr:DUF4431 domain-containing protein [Deltaproteobacteria bacterium]